MTSIVASINCWRRTSFDALRPMTVVCSIMAITQAISSSLRPARFWRVGPSKRSKLVGFRLLRQLGESSTLSGDGMRGGFEEQSLADHRLHRFGLEGLGNEEGGLWPLPGQQSFRIGGDEDHRQLDILQDLVDRIDARTAVGQLDVGQ